MRLLKRRSPDVGEGVPALPCVRYAPTPVGRTGDGAPLRWTEEHLTYMSIPALLIYPRKGRRPRRPAGCRLRLRRMVADTSVTHPTVGVGVLDDPSVGQRITWV